MKDFVQYVNPNIGTIGHLLQATSPTVNLPHGMMQVSPVFTPGITDRYLADKIYAFPLGFGLFMPSISRDTPSFSENASVFDHDFEMASPCEYSVLLEDYGIQVTYTVDKHSAIFSIDMPKAGAVYLYLPGESTFEDGVFTAYEHPRRGRYCFSEFGEIKKKGQLEAPSSGRWNDNGLCTAYQVEIPAGKSFLKVALSNISDEKAEDTMKREIPDWDYEAVRSRAFQAWNEKLSSIEVSGGKWEDMRVFYTAFYRVLTRMQCVSEYGAYYSGYDDAVHEDEGHEFYINDGMWDTFRCAHPIQQMIEPKVHEDIVSSYIRMYQQSGMLHEFPSVTGGKPCMLGTHTTALFADSLAGGTDFDVRTAFEAGKKMVLEKSMLPWYDGEATEYDKCYNEKGFFPALEPDCEEYIPEVHFFEGRQSVAVTLEQSYNEWCIAQLAKALGLQKEEQFFLKRAQNYRNVFDERIGFMAPKTKDGKWIEEYDPKNCGGQGGRAYFAENNAYIYTFNVFHDIPGMIELLGGRESFEARLDQLFVEQPAGSKFSFLAQYPDATGLSGMFCMGNEPSFHIPYLYNYAGKPHKTQRKIREQIRLWFTDSPLGICGDEDGGAMSAWLLYSAMGFYPVCPGSGLYDIGSPIFDECIIRTEKAVFTVKADGASGKAKYVKNRRLNGKELSGFQFPISAIKEGGELSLTMSERP